MVSDLVSADNSKQPGCGAASLRVALSCACANKPYSGSGSDSDEAFQVSLHSGMGRVGLVDGGPSDWNADAACACDACKDHAAPPAHIGSA